MGRSINKIIRFKTFINFPQSTLRQIAYPAIYHVFYNDNSLHRIIKWIQHTRPVSNITVFIAKIHIASIYGKEYNYYLSDTTMHKHNLKSLIFGTTKYPQRTARKCNGKYIQQWHRGNGIFSFLVDTDNFYLPLYQNSVYKSKINALWFSWFVRRLILQWESFQIYYAIYLRRHMKQPLVILPFGRGTDA